jgi:hypothetical protein
MTSIPGYFQKLQIFGGQIPFTLLLQLIGIFLLEVLIKAIGITTNISATPPLPLTDGFHS